MAHTNNSIALHTLEDFVKKLPKVELHAHLNGSLNIASIRELGAHLHGANTKQFLKLCQQFIAFEGLSLDDCFKKFQFMHELTATEVGLKQATLLVIRDFAADNVVHLELRTTPKANEHMSKRDYLCCVLQAIEEAYETYVDISVKLLPSIDRAQTAEAAKETLELVLQLRDEYPRIITGLDLSGNPAAGHFSSFVPVLKEARAQGLKLTLHCAEIDNASEIAEMLAFGMDRCGHGTFLTEKQQQKLGKCGIPIECCLTSNVKCGTVSTYGDHHIRGLLEGNAAAILCTDDSGVFDTTLSSEFMIAAQTFELKITDLKALSLHAVEYAFASDTVKATIRRKIWKFFDENKIL